MKNYKFDEKRKLSIAKFDCADTGEFNNRHEAEEEFAENLEKINEYQQKLFAEQKEGIIFVFQAMDAAGKDGAIRAVLSCLSPQGVSEHSFKVPSAEENRHDYLWRFAKAIPEKGSISILNRSYYEDVLVQKVHQYYLNNKYADRVNRDTMIEDRYEQIRGFEKYLWENSIRVVKIFLNVSKDEQARRFISRIDTPKKNWKFSSGDIDERAYWDEYMEAYETCINRTARKNTPWYVVPADHKWYARLVISRIVLNELENMNPQWPTLPEEEMAILQDYRDVLSKEVGETEKEKEDNTDKSELPDAEADIALEADCELCTEKKFRKMFKKHIFDEISEKFGVSEEIQKQFGKIYLDMEATGAFAQENDVDVISVFKKNKKKLKSQLKGRGKEAKKLYKNYKKQLIEQIAAYEEEINLSYLKFEDSIKEKMATYDNFISTDEKSAEAALKELSDIIKSTYDLFSKEIKEHKQNAVEVLSEISDEYKAIDEAFQSEETAEAENTEDSDAAELVQSIISSESDIELGDD